MSFIDLLLQKNVNSVVHYDIDHIHKNQVNIQYYVSIEKSFEKSRKKISFEHVIQQKQKQQKRGKMLNSAIKSGTNENDCIFKMRLKGIVGVKHNLRM